MGHRSPVAVLSVTQLDRFEASTMHTVQCLITSSRYL